MSDRAPAVFKTYLFIDGHDDGIPHLIDTIWWQSAWWLVGSWLQANATGERIPGTLVRLSGLRFEECQGQPYRFLLHNSLPKAVLDGEGRAGYVVASYPALADSPAPTETRH